MVALLNTEIKTFKQGYITFTLSPGHIIVKTSIQTFFLLPRASYWHKRMHLVRAMIELGEIRDLNELASFCGSGIEWRLTSLPIDALIYNEGRYVK